MTDSPRPTAPCACSGWRAIGYVLAPVLGGALLVTYLAAPQFYLDYVLEGTRREFQVVEIITESAALIGGVMLLWAAHLLWHDPAPDARSRRLASLMLAVVGAAALFLFGEEISWGQKFLQWETPESFAQHSVETNLHNIRSLPISIQGLGSMFIACVFFVVPVLWRMRDRFPVMHKLEYAIACGPAITVVAFGFLWREWKSLHRSVWGTDGAFYDGFLEQINEHKEMFVALGLLVYGIGAWHRARSLRRTNAAEQA